jgi:hypothetical protein
VAQARGAVVAADARRPLVVEEGLDRAGRHAALVEEHLVADDVTGVELAQVRGAGRCGCQRGADDREECGGEGREQAGAQDQAAPGRDGMHHATTTSVWPAATAAPDGDV